MQTSRRQWWRSRWWMPAFSLFLGLLIFAAYTIGGDLSAGIFGLVVLSAFGALFLFGGRSETISGLGGPGRDERWDRIDVHATALTGIVLISVLIGCWLVELAKGHGGNPYGALLAVTGVVYIVAVAVLRWRS